jgi:hypothetical protein
MGAINLRNRYEFDPGSYVGGGGLPGMLQRAWQRQGIDRGPHGVSEDDQNSFAGLRGGVLGTQGAQARYQPDLVESRSASFVPRDSNFRQLSRFRGEEIAPIPSPSHLGNEPTNSPRALGNSFPLSEGASSADDSFDTIGARGIASSTIPVGWRARAFPNRASSPGSASAPPPTLPDWWITAARIGQLLFRGMYGSAGDGNGAYGRCIKASGGSTDDWENFCRFLDRRQNNTVGGESQNRACWGKTFASQEEKKQWCENQFGNR